MSLDQFFIYFNLALAFAGMVITVILAIRENSRRWLVTSISTGFNFFIIFLIYLVLSTDGIVSKFEMRLALTLILCSMILGRVELHFRSIYQKCKDKGECK